MNNFHKEYEALSPIERLISEIDHIRYKSKACLFTPCKNKPIISHTLSQNYLSKLNKDARKILTFNQHSLPFFKDQGLSRLKPVAKNKFSTFIGFCPAHDNNIFNLIDSYNGNLTHEIATLIHYRNICFGIIHVNSGKLKIAHLLKQNYTQSKPTSKKIENMIANLNNGTYVSLLDESLKNHLERKDLLEKMIINKKFNEIEFEEITSTLQNNPIFCGRSNYHLHESEKFFDSDGYAYMPWITYMTLLHKNSNSLVFCWLKQDSSYAKDLFNIFKCSNENFKNAIAILAYKNSDSFAMEKNHYLKNREILDEVLKYRPF